MNISPDLLITSAKEKLPNVTAMCHHLWSVHQTLPYGAIAFFFINELEKLDVPEFPLPSQKKDEVATLLFHYRICYLEFLKKLGN